MLGRILLLTCALAPVVVADLCEPGAPEAFKVRISVKAALGDKAYTWNSAEEYLFKAVMAFTMRSYTRDETFQISNILLCNVTKRVSFWFLVTSPLNDSVPFPGAKVEAAIRHERNRINSAFLLNDKTLEFLEIPPTMASVSESRRSSWLIVFGVIVGLTSVGAMYLVVSGVRRQMNFLSYDFIMKGMQLI
ncbi:collectrin isoform X2 [Spea bombifrons]|uniref:collectrin isoform X2 n=1 Tax=Spea bombifrons TaxID=233779 RepID=UPI00234A1CEC|nr:collectrin isoform X2 [Spea bombifrons]